MPLILDGRASATRWKHRLQAELLEAGAVDKPCLTVILVGEHPASLSYVRHKQKACQEVGITSRMVQFEAGVLEQTLLQAIEALNHDPSVHGILVQLPLPDHVNADRVLEAVRPDKDVDGFHPWNLGQLVVGGPGFVPCTPLGIDHLLADYDIPLGGQHVVIVGRSRIVGKPLALLWSLKRPGGSPTLTLAHSGTRDLEAVCKGADILVVAAGRKGLIGPSHVKPQAVVVDVGIHRAAQASGTHRLVGDVDFEAVADTCRAITPVPGGVGPMTVVALLHNTWLAYQRGLSQI
jgi:methylenetetrahydrofolate dehydrogenase (NADP+)/methenyltetrahydrofolate cyclohydrolase